MPIDKKSLSEGDIRTKFITPAIEQAGWDLLTQVREEVPFTAGRLLWKGKTVKRGKGKRADYILYHKPNIPIAVVEAKDNKHTVGDGMQQALGYPGPASTVAEQKRIVAKVDQLMSIFNKLESKLTQSQADSEKLMEAVVAGVLNQGNGKG